MIATQPPSPSPTVNTIGTSPRTPRRPSMSNPRSWLSLASGAHIRSHSVSSTPNPLHISEPQLVHDLFTTSGGPTYTHSRYGVLGTGATVVRTPQDALARAMLIQTQPYPSHDPPGTTDDEVSSYDEDEPASPASPSLPLVPRASKSSPNLLALSEMGELLPRPEDSNPSSKPRSKPTRPCPIVPASTTHLSLKSTPASLPAVPTLPLCLTPTPPQPPFTPILLSPIPDILPNLSSLIVTLDTSTCSLRTTYATLTSRPSHLASYLQSLAHAAYEREKRKFRDTLMEEDEDEEVEDCHSLSAPDTPFASLFTAHLTSAGLLPQSSMIHLFLDRPSAPYVHILTYLRSPTSSATLPRTASLGSRCSQTPERLETLLELRDEAKYLGLEELHKLCCDELRLHQGHVRGRGGSNNSSISSIASNPTGQQIIVSPERGRDTTLVRLGAIMRREVPHGVPQGPGGTDRDSAGSIGQTSARSEVVHVEGVPVSPSSSSAGIRRTMSPVVEAPASRSHSRSQSRGPLRSADWI